MLKCFVSFWEPGILVHASQVALVAQNPPASAGDIKAWVGSLGQEEPLEEGMAGYSS